MTDNTVSPHEPIPVETDTLAKEIVDAAYKVHSALGPGLLEGVYEACLVRELAKKGIKVERQVSLPIVYDGVRLDAGLKLDILVGSRVIVELKSVEDVQPLHVAQLLTYLKLSGLRLGLLVNFNVRMIRDGITRIAL